MKISASIVIYNEDKKILEKAINSFVDINYDKELIIIDNSPKEDLKNFCRSFNNIKYIFTEKNLGFGVAHNIAFKHLETPSDIHLCINPDIYFNTQEMEAFLEWFYYASTIPLATPLICNYDGSNQNAIREIPSPLTLLKRKLNLTHQDRFYNTNFKSITEIPFAHGCFLVFKTSIFQKLDGFDEQFFLYMEDIDIFIRAKEYGQTVVNPYCKVYHEHRRGSSKSLKLLYHHISSAIKFFWKHR